MRTWSILLTLALSAGTAVSVESVGSVVQANDERPAPTAAVCQSSVGPGIPPPTSVPSGTLGFHASWYGQSGYMTLCPGDTMTATVAMYNSGSFGWLKGLRGQVAYLGTWNPIPGQDQPSILGGDGQGSPNTGWPRANRVAVQPADWVGPNQVAWFQFTIRAPQSPGTYDLYIRPLIEGSQWMEDYGIYWRITVPAVSVGTPAKLACSTSWSSIGAGSTQPSTITVQVQDADSHTVFSDSGRSITLAQSGTTGSLDGGAPGASSTKTISSSGTVTWVLTQPSAAGIGVDQISASTALLAGCSTSVMFIDGHAAPTVTVMGEGRGSQTDNRLSISDPPSNVDGLTYSIQRTVVTRTTVPCDASSGTFTEIATLTMPRGAHAASYLDPNLPNGVYCYRVGSTNPTTGTTAFGYSNYAYVQPPVGP